MLNKSYSLGYSKLIYLMILLFLASSSNTIAGLTSKVQDYDVHLSFDVSNHWLIGVANLNYKNEKQDLIGFWLNSDFDISKVELNGKLTKFTLEQITPDRTSTNYGVNGNWGDDLISFYSVDLPSGLIKSDEDISLSVHYNGKLYTEPDNRQFSREKIAMEAIGTIGEDGIYLSPAAFWYPRTPDSPASHTITCELPTGWNFVTDGYPIKETKHKNGVIVKYVSEEPTEGLTLSAGPYTVFEENFGDVTIATYFLPAQAELAEGYVKESIRYVQMYSEWIGTYPFSRFTVVDNFMPSGYGMPGWTLLGSEVLRLPFIKYTSLGHEVLHNWWGNSLYVDYREGNWCEGLTTYMADHYYKAKASPIGGMEYRRDILRDYSNYVNSQNVYPVSEFISRSDAADRSIGYGKVMMIFRMLHNWTDYHKEGAFYGVLADVYSKHQWQAVGWSHWINACAEAIESDLSHFSDVWVKGTDLPELSLLNVNSKPNGTNGDRWQTTIQVAIGNVTQDMPFILPVTISGENDRSASDWFKVNSLEHTFEIETDFAVTKVQLDPDFDLFRMPYKSELPTTLASFFGDSEAVFVVPSAGDLAEPYLKVAEGLKQNNQRIVTETEVTAELLSTHSVWLMGTPKSELLMNTLNSSIDTKSYKIAETEVLNTGYVSTEIIDNPNNKDKVLVYTISERDLGIVEGMRKLSHYGRYSYVIFDNGKAISTGVNAPNGASPMIWQINN